MLITLPSLLLNTAAGKFICSGLKTILDSASATLSKSTHGYSIVMRQQTSQNFVRSGMKPDPYYRGSVIINRGETELDELATAIVEGAAGEIVPALVSAIGAAD